MTSHPDEDTLQRLLDDELPVQDGAAVRRHLAGCAVCRMEMDALETAFQSVSRAVALLEPPAVSLDLAHASVKRRLRSGAPIQRTRHLRRAALFLLAFGGAASATLPGSPVRQWAESLWHTGPAVEAPDGHALHESATDAVVASAGVSVRPADGELRLVVENSSPELRIRVRLTDQTTMSVRGIGEAAGARFRMGRGRVTVADAGAGEIEVLIPRAAPRASITVNGRRLLAKNGEDLQVLAPADSVGTEIVFPARF